MTGEQRKVQFGANVEHERMCLIDEFLCFVFVPMLQLLGYGLKIGASTRQ